MKRWDPGARRRPYERRADTLGPALARLRSEPGAAVLVWFRGRHLRLCAPDRFFYDGAHEHLGVVGGRVALVRVDAGGRMLGTRTRRNPRILATVLPPGWPARGDGVLRRRDREGDRP